MTRSRLEAFSDGVIAIGRDWKGKASVLAYAAAIPLAFVYRWIAIAIYVAVAILWWIPDLRIEKTIDRAVHRSDSERG